MTEPQNYFNSLKLIALSFDYIRDFRGPRHVGMTE